MVVSKHADKSGYHTDHDSACYKGIFILREKHGEQKAYAKEDTYEKKQKKSGQQI